MQTFSPLQLFINVLKDLADGWFSWITPIEFKYRKEAGRTDTDRKQGSVTMATKTGFNEPSQQLPDVSLGPEWPQSPLPLPHLTLQTDTILVKLVLDSLPLGLLETLSKADLFTTVSYLSTWTKRLDLCCGHSPLPMATSSCLLCHVLSMTGLWRA